MFIIENYWMSARSVTQQYCQYLMNTFQPVYRLEAHTTLEALSNWNVILPTNVDRRGSGWKDKWWGGTHTFPFFHKQKMSSDNLRLYVFG